MRGLNTLLIMLRKPSTVEGSLAQLRKFLAAGSPPVAAARLGVSLHLEAVRLQPAIAPGHVQDK